MALDAYKAMEQALDFFRSGKMTVTITEYKTCPTRKVEVPVKTKIYENEPCHLSFGGTTSQDEYKTTTQTGAMVLFTKPDIEIPPNSTIEIEQNGEKYTVKNTKAKAYKTHKAFDVEEVNDYSDF